MSFSVLQGKDLLDKLNKPKGATIQSSTRLEKHKLEDDVKQLQSTITELERYLLVYCITATVLL